MSLPHYFICILPFLWWSTIVIANVFWSLYGCIRFVLVRIPRWWLTQCCSRWNKSRCKRRGLPASSLCPPRKNLLLENADSLLCYCSLLQAKLLSLADISRACKYQVWPANPLPRRFNVDATMTSRSASLSASRWTRHTSPTGAHAAFPRRSAVRVVRN